MERSFSLFITVTNSDIFNKYTQALGVYQSIISLNIWYYQEKGNTGCVFNV